MKRKGRFLAAVVPALVLGMLSPTQVASAHDTLPLGFYLFRACNDLGACKGGISKIHLQDATRYRFFDGLAWRSGTYAHGDGSETIFWTSGPLKREGVSISHVDEPDGSSVIEMFNSANGYSSEYVWAGCFGQAATIVGSGANDTIAGTTARDVIVAGYGNDIVYGAAGNDLLCGNHGKDTIYGLNGADQISGGPGDDNSTARQGRFFVAGLFGGAGGDTIHGDDGSDHVWAEFNANNLEFGNDPASVVNTLRGGAGGDWIISGGSDWLFGDDDNDNLQDSGVAGAGGEDHFDGGAGESDACSTWEEIDGQGFELDVIDEETCERDDFE